MLANRGATARERRVHAAASMQRKCNAPRTSREYANAEAFKEVRLIFFNYFFFSLSLELNALHLQASAGINTHIYAHDYAGRTTGVVHTEVRIRSHTCIFTFLCACRVVVGHAKKEIERERDGGRYIRSNCTESLRDSTPTTRHTRDYSIAAPAHTYRAFTVYRKKTTKVLFTANIVQMRSPRGV